MGCRVGRRFGFTLIELLVVIAIIAILAAILFPIFMKAQMNARGAKCMSNLRQLGLAFREYNQSYNLRFMPAAGWGYTGKTWALNAFPYVLRKYGYVKTDRIFYCPSAPSRTQDFKSDPLGSGQQNDPNAADCGWIWSRDGSKSHYGNNIGLAGADPDAMDRGVETPWIPDIPFESDVRSPAQIIYMTDSRWVDLYGAWHPGRIGNARRRHNEGANCVCVDGHCRWMHYTWLNAWPMRADANPRWNYRK